MVTCKEPVNRVHRGNRTTTRESRWMHKAEEVVPFKEKEGLSAKDMVFVVATEIGMMLLFFFLWWNFC